MDTPKVGLTFDTGVLIAIERRHLRATRLVDSANLLRKPITVPAAVIAEWWRGRTDVREDTLASVTVERLDTALAQLAGEALAAVPGATLVDAIVMASASRRGDMVVTTDFDDLDRLRQFFPNVRISTV
jgi:predicted nucleic acid-binding protein